MGMELERCDPTKNPSTKGLSVSMNPKGGIRFEGGSAVFLKKHLNNKNMQV